VYIDCTSIRNVTYKPPGEKRPKGKSGFLGLESATTVVGARDVSLEKSLLVSFFKVVSGSETNDPQSTVVGSPLIRWRGVSSPRNLQQLEVENARKLANSPRRCWVSRWYPF